MTTKNYFSYLVTKIHSTVIATVEENGLPVTCAIDMMDYDENGLYFLTAKGKGFYDRLKKKGFISLTGMDGQDTMNSVAISVHGKVRERGTELLPRLFEKNPHMREIYPTQESMSALTVFQIFEGSGEWFDLSKKPIERENFTFGGAENMQKRYFINDNCTGCKLCYFHCPQKCITIMEKTTVIQQRHCLHCGNCFAVCPAGAVEKRGETL